MFIQPQNIVQMKFFFSKDEALFEKVKTNIKNSFKYIGKYFKSFNINELVLLNPKFEIKKKFKDNKPGFLLFNKLKNKKIYNKITIFLEIISPLGHKNVPF